MSLLSPDELRLKTSVLAFKKAFKNIALRRVSKSPSATNDDSDKPTTNGAIKTESEDDAVPSLQESRSALTVYGQAQGPKQLFSSLQKSQHVKIEGAVDKKRPFADIDVVVPIQESVLPHIITTTEILPPTSNEIIGSKRKRNPTFAEIFPTPSTVHLVAPPKPNKHLTTRDSNVSFIKNDNLPKPNQTGVAIYSTERLAVGKWLGYDHVEVTQEPSVKRKQRDRALSTGKAEPMTENVKAAFEQAKLDALFRSVYSSFAPSKDDSAAVIPSEVKEKLWWNKIGEKRFEEALILDPALAAIDDENAKPENDAEEELDEDTIKEAVENFEPVENPFSDEKLDKDAEEILREISELLETLHSHQRIRNATLPTKSIGTDPGTKQLVGSPTTPSTAEVDVYFMLRDQLSLMISQLPPYAVAKLNGDQLEDLNISRKIVTETKDYRGVMEEDIFSRLAKQAAISSAVGTPTVSRSHVPYAAAANPYARGTPVGQPSRPIQASQAYQQRPQQPSASYPRQPASGAHYGTPTSYAANGQRPAYPASYPQATPRPNSYPTTAASAYYQNRPQQSNFGGAYYANAHTPAATAAQIRAYAQAPASASAYTPRPGAPAAAYSSNPAPAFPSPTVQRTATPTGYGYGQRPPVGYAVPQPNGQQTRGYYAGSPAQGTPAGVYNSQAQAYQKPGVGTPQSQRVNGL